jgi:hypothetical protein
MKKSNDLNSMNPEDFEQQIKQRPVRSLPPEWRAEILGAAKAAAQAAPEPRQSIFATIREQLSVFLWPHPRAWAGIAAVWLVIIALRMMEPGAPVQETAEKRPVRQAAVMALTEERRELAQLLGDFHSVQMVLPPPQPMQPRPRSERRENVAAV